MQVQNESDLTLFTDLVEKVFYACDFRANRIFFARVPLSIQVFTCKIRPVMAINDTINIYHWNNIKYVIFPQEITLFTFRKQFVNYAFTNKRPLSLAWMLSCHNNDSLACIFFLHEVLTYFQAFNRSFRKSLSDDDLLDDILMKLTLRIYILVKLSE
jgi:hypothetical protein